MKKHILLSLFFTNASILFASTDPIAEDTSQSAVVQPYPQHALDQDTLRFPIPPSPEVDREQGFIDQIGEAFTSILHELGSSFGGLNLFGWPYISDDELNSPREAEPVVAALEEPKQLPEFTGDLHRLLKNLSSLDSCKNIFDRLQDYTIKSLNFSGCNPIVFISFINYFKEHENSFSSISLISLVGHKLNPTQLHDLLETVNKRIKGPMHIDLTPAHDYNALILAGLAGRYCIKNANLKIVLTAVSLPKNFKFLNLPKGLILNDLGEVESNNLADRLNLIRRIMREEKLTLVDGNGAKLLLE